MAVLKIYNDIQTENEKAVCRFWGDAEGVCFKDVDEFVTKILYYICYLMSLTL